MSALDALLPYVRTGTTEGDLRFLMETFVSPEELAELCGIEPGSMRLLTASKGVGKSAIAEYLKKKSIEARLPCLLIRPDQLVDLGAPAALDISALKSYYYNRLLRTVAVEIGSQLPNYYPLVGSAKKLYNEAKAENQSKADLVTKTLDLLSAVAAPAKGINGTKLAKGLAGDNSQHALIRAINTQLLPDASKVFLLIIDDTDQLASPDEPQQLNRIWALILAARRLAMECNAVRPLLTLRSSVWSRLMNEDAGQRDQVDHIRPVVFSLNVSDDFIKSVIEKRLRRAAKDAEIRTDEFYTPFFDSDRMTLPTSDEQRSWASFLVKSARERPRDALQLIKNMIDVAKRENHLKIGDRDAEKAMRVYSGERIDDVVSEYALDFPSIREAMNSFGFVDFELDFEALRNHLAGVGGATAIRIRGQQVDTQQDEGMVKLLAILHEVGFINPRFPDASKPRNFRHVNYSEDPNFVRHSNWNNIQGATWEVHPAFRDHLLGLKRARELRSLVKKVPNNP